MTGLNYRIEAVKEFNSAFAQAPRRRGTLMGMARVAAMEPKESD
jgi:hypothetical protein